MKKILILFVSAFSLFIFFNQTNNNVHASSSSDYAPTIEQPQKYRSSTMKTWVKRFKKQGYVYKISSASSFGFFSAINGKNYSQKYVNKLAKKNLKYKVYNITIKYHEQPKYYIVSKNNKVRLAVQPHNLYNVYAQKSDMKHILSTGVDVLNLFSGGYKMSIVNKPLSSLNKIKLPNNKADYKVAKNFIKEVNNYVNKPYPYSQDTTLVPSINFS